MRRQDQHREHPADEGDAATRATPSTFAVNSV